ncbi:MAG: hypothetical protein H0W58_12510 [Acidobacteria bacterium]|jgi:hypothetical protein|nr:hypothetical protein [Acidobacteriota bacterium]
MTNVNEIHRSIAEADDLEEVEEQEISIGDVFRSLGQHPFQIITRWNWKSALLGAILRASFYFTVYKASKESWIVTFTAVIIELAFRFVTSGISGSLVQSFRRATPKWLATLIVTISLPLFSHSVEYITHYSQEHFFSNVFAASENNARQKAFAISVLFSVLSALFNLFVMRHGVLLVGAGRETKSLWGDLKRIPLLIGEFVTFLPLQILSFINKGNILAAIGVFSAFGLIIGTLLGVFRGKWSWAWTTALGAWAIMLVWTLIVAVGARIYRQYVKN